MFQCPPGSVAVSGGGGIMCQCPDGSYAGLYTGCQAHYQQPLCPAGTQYCGNSNQCCNPGFYCSHYGCTPQGAMECGNHYCNPGYQCSRNGGCIPQGKVDCGRGRYCPEGTVCWTASADIPGIVNRGDMKCPTSEQAAQFDARIAQLAAERRQRIEDEREARRRAIEEKREAARQKEEERKAEIAREKAVAIEARRQAEEQRRVELEQKKADAIEAKRRADIARRVEVEQRKAVAQLDHKLLAIVNNRHESNVAREIAKIALGENPKRAGGRRHNAGSSDASALYRPTAAERKLSEVALSRVRPPTASAPSSASSSDDWLRSIMNNPQETPAARKIAAIGLGLNPASIDSPQGPIPLPPAPSAKVTDSQADTNVTRPYLGVGQNAIDNAFSSSTDKTLASKAGGGVAATTTRSYLEVGQQAIDSAFSSIAKKLGIVHAGTKSVERPLITESNASSPVDGFLHSVINDANRSLSDKKEAAAALNDTPTFREIAAIALGADSSNFKPGINSGITSSPHTAARSLTPVQLQFLKENSVVLTPPPKIANNRTATTVVDNATVAVTGFSRVVQPVQSPDLMTRLGDALKFANNSVGDDPNFHAGVKELTITGAIAGVGCVVGGGLAAAGSLGVAALPGCVGGAELFTSVYGAGSFGISVANGVLDLGQHQYGKAATEAVQTAAEQFADQAPVGGMSSMIKAGGSWGTYFLYGFYNNVPEQ
jgi:hypothetical protein